MKNNDDLISMQGDIYTLVDAEGYLVREDIKGSRKRYAFTSSGGGGGIEYKAGNGIIIKDDVISVDVAMMTEEILASDEIKDIESKIGDIESILDVINGEVI